MPSWRSSPPSSAFARPRPAARAARDARRAATPGVGKTRLLMALCDTALEAGWQVVAGHCLDLADSSLPYLPFSEILGRADGRPPRRRDAGCSSSTPRSPASSRAAASAAARPRRATRPSTAATSTTRSATSSPPSPSRPRSSSWSRTPTGPTSRPATCSASSSPDPSPVSRSSSPTAPTTSTAATRCAARSRSGCGCAASTGSSSSRSPTTTYAASSARCAPARCRRRSTSPSSTAPRATRSSSRSWSAPRGPARCPASSPTCCSSTSTGSTRSPAAWCASCRWPGARSATACSPPSPTSTPPSSRRALRTAVEANVLVASRGGTYAFRHALLGEAVYDDLLPGERMRLHADFVSALGEGRAVGTAAELAQHARRADDRPVAIRAVDRGRRGGAGRRWSLRGRHPLPRRARAHRHLAHAGARHRRRSPSYAAAPRRWSPPAGCPRRSRCSAPGWPPCRPSASDVDRGQLLTALASALLLTDTTDSPREIAAEAVELLRGGPPKLLARALFVHAETLGNWHADEARDRGAARRSSWPSATTSPASPSSCTPRSPGSTPPAARTPSVGWRAAADRARRGRAASSPSCAPSTSSVGSTTTAGDLDTAVAVYREVLARSEVGGLAWSPYPAEARLLLAVALTHQGRLGKAWWTLDVSGQDPPMVYEWLYFAHQVFITVRPARRPPQRRRPRAAARALGHRRPHRHHRRQRRDPPGGGRRRPGRGAGGLRRRRRGRRAAVARVVPGPAAPRDPGRRRLRRRGARTSPPTSARRAAARRRAADGRRRPGHRLLLPLRGSRGPEYRMWVARRAAEHLRWRWLAQVDPPSSDELVEAWRAAEEAAVAYGSVPELAQARVRLAGVLRAVGRRRRRPDRGRPGARGRARDEGRGRCWPSCSRRARRRPPRPRAPRVGRSPRARREILALVAEGRSNGEIGKQLFISTKTVSVHVSNILGQARRRLAHRGRRGRPAPRSALSSARSGLRRCDAGAAGSVPTPGV